MQQTLEIAPCTSCAYDLETLVEQSWQKIAPFWPLKNLIAVNPLQGLEDMPIEQALTEAAGYFQHADMPLQMHEINRETIKWLQVYCDEGQAHIRMPLQQQGLYKAWRQITSRDYLQKGESPQEAIKHGLETLGIETAEQQQFLTLLLTTLPGWSGYIKCHADWSEKKPNTPSPSKIDYIAMRLAITCTLWPEAKQLLQWHLSNVQTAQSRQNWLHEVIDNESAYRTPLLHTLALPPLDTPHKPDAQLVFCIDVRSEPFRRALEATGNYETYGFAGFFGIPMRVKNMVTEESYASCPVLISPKHEIKEYPTCCEAAYQKKYNRMTVLKEMYHTAKHNFSTPFALVEAMGAACGAWMLLRTFMPKIASSASSLIKHYFGTEIEQEPSIDAISLSEQCAHALAALKMIGLTSNFSPIVVFCGHGSTTQNNAFATILDCGACGGHHGASNAMVISKILNRPEVRYFLKNHNIHIPQETLFVGAEHNTTTDEVRLFGTSTTTQYIKLKNNLEKAKKSNSHARANTLKKGIKHTHAHKHTASRSTHWAEVRPEWGLANNASFIIAPRALTKAHNLQGRCFLHSYDYKQDTDLTILKAILTAPMVVAQWINAQYLFSSLDNIAFGGGSKTTQNITGKIGIMQGNASDLMTGLPLQSVYSCDNRRYHEPQRLMTVVYAPKASIDAIVSQESVLKKLFGNGWVQLACIEPSDHKCYYLQRDFTWKQTE